MSDPTAPPPEPSDPRATPPPPPPAPAAWGSSAPPPAPPMSSPYGAPPPAASMEAPGPVKQAVTLMKVGAALSLVGALLTFLMRDTMEEAARDALEQAGQPLDEGAINSVIALGMGMAVVFGLIGAGLWLWMAKANGDGRSWARIVATVFFALSTLNFLAGFAQPSPMLSRVVSFVTWALGAYIIFLLYKKESSQFYAARSAPRY